jgi:DNA-binding PadR family transcriptional regulator
VFSNSLTNAWSSSTGSIYPSIKRLAAHGFIMVSPPAGGRSSRALSVSPSGSAEVVRWLTSDMMAIAGPTPDPIRTRSSFLSLLDEAKQAEFVANALTATRVAIKSAETARRARCKSHTLEDRVSEGVLYELRARVAWLKAMIISNHSGPRPFLNN